MGKTYFLTMQVLLALLSTVACLCLVEAGTVDIDWKYGMEDPDTAVCVPPGTIINFVWESNHNVVEVATPEDFEACTGFTDTTPYEGPLAPCPRGGGYLLHSVRGEDPLC